MIASLLIAMLVVLDGHTVAQPVNPCNPAYPYLVYTLQRPMQKPPVSIYMPYDVLLGYIALDTFQYRIPPGAEGQLVEFLKRQTSWNDTLKTITRIWYAMADYDPMLYISRIWKFRITEPAPLMWQDILLENIIKAADNIKAARRDRALLQSHYILHIMVVDTVQTRLPAPPELREKSMCITTSCLVQDVIKGQVAPLCNTAFLRGWLTNNRQTLDSGRCLQFTYCPHWSRRGDGDVVDVETDSMGNIVSPALLGEILSPGCEYIVFLRYSMGCRSTDTTQVDHYTLDPIRVEWEGSGESSYGFGIYPVVDGIVQDPMDDFGFGTNLSVEQFKQRLRERIAEIKNW